MTDGVPALVMHWATMQAVALKKAANMLNEADAPDANGNPTQVTYRVEVRRVSPYECIGKVYSDSDKVELTYRFRRRKKHWRVVTTTPEVLLDGEPINEFDNLSDEIQQILLSMQVRIPAKSTPKIDGSSPAQSNAALREKKNTVIRV